MNASCSATSPTAPAGCCGDDFSASALGADLLIHYSHSCLVPIDVVKILSLYVFAGTIQFSAAVRAAKSALSDAGFAAAVPQSKPLSAGEVLGCTSPSIPKNAVDVAVFVADGPFHLEAFMIANPGIKAFRYDPYLKVLLWEEYDHGGMKEARKNAILKQPLYAALMHLFLFLLFFFISFFSLSVLAVTKCGED